RTAGLRCRWRNRYRWSCGNQLAVNVGQHPRELLYASDSLGTARPEHLWKGIDPRRADAHVVHRHARVVGFLDGMRRVGPRVAALITFVGDQAVADDDQQASLGGLGQQPARQMAKWRTESGVPTG